MKNPFEYFIPTDEEKLRRQSVFDKIKWWQILLAIFLLPWVFFMNAGNGTVTLRTDIFCFVLVLLIEFSLIGLFVLVKIILNSIFKQNPSGQDTALREEAWEKIFPIMTALQYKEKYAELSQSEQVLRLCQCTLNGIWEAGLTDFFRTTPIEMCVLAKEAFLKIGAKDFARIMQAALDITPVILGDGTNEENRRKLFDSQMNEKILKEYSELAGSFLTSDDNQNLLVLLLDFIEQHESDISV